MRKSTVPLNTKSVSELRQLCKLKNIKCSDMTKEQMVSKLRGNHKKYKGDIPLSKPKRTSSCSSSSSSPARSPSVSVKDEIVSLQVKSKTPISSSSSTSTTAPTATSFKSHEKYLENQLKIYLDQMNNVVDSTTLPIFRKMLTLLDENRWYLRNNKQIAKNIHEKMKHGNVIIDFQPLSVYLETLN